MKNLDQPDDSATLNLEISWGGDPEYEDIVAMRGAELSLATSGLAPGSVLAALLRTAESVSLAMARERVIEAASSNLVMMPKSTIETIAVQNARMTMIGIIVDFDPLMQELATLSIPLDME